MRLYDSTFCLLLLLGIADFARGQVAVDTPRIAPGHTTERLVRGAAGPSRKVIGPPLAQAIKDSLIKKIRAVFQRINSDTLNEVEADYDDDFMDSHPADNGVTLKGYFKKDTLLKMFVQIGRSFGPVTYEYYFDKEQPVFIFELQQRYPYIRDSGFNYDKLLWVSEGRYYFEKGKLIHKVLKGEKSEDLDDEYFKALLDISDDVKSLRKALHPKRPAPPSRRA